VLGPRDDVRPVYDAADALVLPSHTEGIPGAAIEAALSGLPVVSFPVGGVPSVVVSGRTGILVDSRNPASVAEALEIAVDRRAEWGMAGRQRCLEMFSMESVGAAWERVVADVSALGQPPVEGR
jgi:glycosyltransferase involved in cell wall biosynthesis